MKELLTIQSKLNAPKGQYNSFGKYKYRSCEDILAAVKPLLAETKCTLNLSDEMVLVGDRIYVKAIATLTNCDGEEKSTTAFAREEEEKKGMDASQVTGAASSYARKYALNGLFAIDDTKDSDATNTHGKEVKEEKSDEMSVSDIIRNYVKPAVEQANTEDELRKIWNTYPALQRNKEFIDVVTDRKDAIQ